jgi:hypothetical protein
MILSTGLLRLVGDFAGKGSFAGKPNFLALPLCIMVHFNDSMLPFPCAALSSLNVTKVPHGAVAVSLSVGDACNLSHGLRAELQSDWVLGLRF